MVGGLRDLADGDECEKETVDTGLGGKTGQVTGGTKGGAAQGAEKFETRGV